MLNIMKDERVRNVAGVLVFYLILVLGVIAVNARMENVNNSTSQAVLAQSY